MTFRVPWREPARERVAGRVVDITARGWRRTGPPRPPRRRHSRDSAFGAEDGRRAAGAAEPSDATRVRRSARPGDLQG